MINELNQNFFSGKETTGPRWESYQSMFANSVTRDFGNQVSILIPSVLYFGRIVSTLGVNSNLGILYLGRIMYWRISYFGRIVFLAYLLCA